MSEKIEPRKVWFSFFRRKTNAIYLMVEEYLLQMYESIRLFNKTISIYFEEGITDLFIKLIDETHSAESKADDTRRDIEISFYEKSLIPESRGDILEVIESIDKVFNKAQSVLYQIETESLLIPDEFHTEFKNLIDINMEAYVSAIKGFKILFTNTRDVKNCVKEVDEKESFSDRKERELIRMIFSSEYQLGEKILLKELVTEIGCISDLSEEVADVLSIIAVKRMI
ncbi:DUF47 family protein [bacterium]|nr:DUF47 family protein [bacterium]